MNKKGKTMASKKSATVRKQIQSSKESDQMSSRQTKKVILSPESIKNVLAYEDGFKINSDIAQILKMKDALIFS